MLTLRPGEELELGWVGKGRTEGSRKKDGVSKSPGESRLAWPISLGEGHRPHVIVLPSPQPLRGKGGTGLAVSVLPTQMHRGTKWQKKVKDADAYETLPQRITGLPILQKHRALSKSLLPPV